MQNKAKIINNIKVEENLKTGSSSRDSLKITSKF